MGADFMCAISTLPHTENCWTLDLSVEAALSDIAQKRIAAMNSNVVAELAELYIGEDFEPESLIDEVIKLIWVALGNSRDTTVREIDGKLYLITGGMSWGDTPTDSFDAVGLMGDLGVWDEPLDEEELA